MVFGRKNKLWYTMDLSSIMNVLMIVYLWFKVIFVLVQVTLKLNVLILLILKIDDIIAGYKTGASCIRIKTRIMAAMALDDLLVFTFISLHQASPSILESRWNNHMVWASWKGSSFFLWFGLLVNVIVRLKMELMKARASDVSVSWVLRALTF